MIYNISNKSNIDNTTTALQDLNGNPIKNHDVYIKLEKVGHDSRSHLIPCTCAHPAINNSGLKFIRLRVNPYIGIELLFRNTMFDVSHDKRIIIIEK